MRAEARHQLKSDAFASATAGTLSWAADNRKRLIYGGTVAALVLAVVLVLWYWNHQRNLQANAELGGALLTYQTPVAGANSPPPQPGEKTFPSYADRAKAAQSQFAVVADKYGSTSAGRMARYFEALTYEDLGDNAGAEKQLRSVADSGNADVSALAKYALAQLYASEGKQNDAAKVYQDLMNHPAATVTKSSAQLGLAEIYEKSQPQEARRLYEQIQKDDAKSPAAQMATQRLAGLK